MYAFRILKRNDVISESRDLDIQSFLSPSLALRERARKMVAVSSRGKREGGSGGKEEEFVLKGKKIQKAWLQTK